MKIKDKLKRLSALACAVLVGSLSCLPAFAVDISNMSREETQEYVHKTSDTFLLPVEIDKVSLDYVTNFFDVEGNKIPSKYNSNNEVDKFGTRLENIVSGAPCDLSDIGYDIFIFAGSENLVLTWFYYVKTDTARFDVSDYNGKKQFKFNEKCFYTMVNYTYDSSTDSYVYSTYHNLTVDYKIMPSGSVVLSNDYDMFYYSDNNNIPALDENGNNLTVHQPVYNTYFIEYEPHQTFDNNGLVSSNIDFTIYSDKPCYVQVDLYEGDNNTDFTSGNIWAEHFNRGDFFYTDYKNVFRYNVPEFVADNQKVNVTLSYNQMLNREYPDQIMWWKHFITTNVYFNRDNYDLEVQTAILNALDDRQKWTGFWRVEGAEFGDITFSGGTGTVPDYTVETVRDYLFWCSTTNMFDVIQIFTETQKDVFEKMAKDHTATIPCYVNDMDSNRKYRSTIFIDAIDGLFSINVDVSNIDYVAGKRYYWILTYQPFSLDDAGLDMAYVGYLTKPLYADYKVWYAPNTKLDYVALPYGDGINHSYNNVFDSNGNLYGTFDGNGNITVNPDNEIVQNEFANKEFSSVENVEELFDFTNTDSLFDNSKGFIDFLARGFSLLPSFIWALLATGITVCIFLRVLGR